MAEPHPRPIQIDFVSDVACPWCAIGLAGLEEALRRTAGLVTARIRFQPFELNPGMPAQGENIDSYIGSRYGASANFTDGANVADHEVLVAAAAAAGLHAQQAREVLATGRYAQEVRQAEQLWTSRGVQGVPAIIVNDQWLISGGQPPDQFEAALREIAAEA